MATQERIAAVGDVPADGTLLFTVREGFDEHEAILTKLDDGTIVGFRNHCQHWTDVRLDSGSGAEVRNGDILCTRHGATFRKDDGVCEHGPCEGATLDLVDVVVQDGAVYLDDPDYAFDSLGPSDDHDLSSGPSIGFDGV